MCHHSLNSPSFFGSFDDVKAAQSGGGDGFDAAAMSSAWGEPVASADPPAGDGQDLGNGFDGEIDGGDDKKDSDQRRSSRRRQPGARQGRSNRGGVEAGMEAMKINGEDPRKRSSSRSKRKARGARPEKS